MLLLFLYLLPLWLIVITSILYFSSDSHKRRIRVNNAKNIVIKVSIIFTRNAHETIVFSERKFCVVKKVENLYFFQQKKFQQLKFFNLKNVWLVIGNRKRETLDRLFFVKTFNVQYCRELRWTFLKYVTQKIWKGYSITGHLYQVYQPYQYLHQTVRFWLESMWQNMTF